MRFLDDLQPDSSDEVLYTQTLRTFGRARKTKGIFAHLTLARQLL